MPNLASVFGYVNASWTLRADLVARYVCRILEHMDRVGAVECTPRLRPQDSTMRPLRWIEGFTPGYWNRYMDHLPRQGDHAPWINPQVYRRDRRLFLPAPIDNGAMQFR